MIVSTKNWSWIITWCLEYKEILNDEQTRKPEVT
jgi:hypothetical protein